MPPLQTPTRVLYASFDAVPSPKGASAHIVQSVRALSEHRQVDLLTLSGSLPSAELPESVRRDTFSSEAENFLQRALEWGDHVARRLASERYDVVHVRSIWEGTPALLLRAVRGYRLVYEVNGLPSIELKYHYPALAQSPELIARLRAQERALMRAADLVITQSRTTRNYLRSQGAGGGRLVVIPNGVDAGRFPKPLSAVSDLSDLSDLSDRWDLSDGERRVATILYLGTLAPWQGLPYLISAVAAARTPYRLRIVGTGRREWRRGLERQIRRLGLEERAVVEPPIAPEEVPALLASVDVAAAPLAVTDRNVIQGCCPLKILEYMAAGKAIVAPRMPTVRELLEHERTALLYRPDRPRRLAETLDRLAEDPELRRRLGMAAAEDARTRFPWSAHDQALRQAYASLGL
jgi:glycosyltransferase involved in cell wall biosynthesis